MKNDFCNAGTSQFPTLAIQIRQFNFDSIRLYRSKCSKQKKKKHTQKKIWIVFATFFWSIKPNSYWRLKYQPNNRTKVEKSTRYIWPSHTQLCDSHLSYHVNSGMAVHYLFKRISVVLSQCNAMQHIYTSYQSVAYFFFISFEESIGMDVQHHISYSCTTNVNNYQCVDKNLDSF